MATQTPSQAQKAHLHESLRILDRLQREMRREATRPSDDINWGDVGSANDIRRALQALSDQVFSEGEYAHTACLRCGGSYATIGGDPNDHAAHAAYEAALAAGR